MNVNEFIVSNYIEGNTPIGAMVNTGSYLVVWCIWDGSQEMHVWNIDDGLISVPKDRPLDLCLDTVSVIKDVDTFELFYGYLGEWADE